MSSSTRSPWDGGDRDVLFAAIALVGAWDLCGVAIDLLARSSTALAHPEAPRWLLALAHTPVLVVALALVGLVGLGCVARSRTRTLGLVIALAISLVLGETLAAATEGPWRARFFVGAALFGALFGELWGRWAGAGAHTRARAAEIGALGMLAATWFGAGLSKLGGAGFGWADATTLRAIALAHAHVDAPGLASVVATSPVLARVLAIATVLVQLAAPALLFGPRARLFGALALVSFHLGVAAVTRIGYWQPVALLVVLALPWPRWVARWRSAAPDEDSITPSAHARARNRLVVLAIALVVVAWLPGVRAYTAGHHRPRMGDGGSVVARTAVQTFGPLAVGDELPGAWRIDAIEREDERAGIVIVHASHGRVVLWISPRARAPSPFDGETVAVAYAEAAAPLASFAPAARAIAQHLDAAPSPW